MKKLLWAVVLGVAAMGCVEHKAEEPFKVESVKVTATAVDVVVSGDLTASGMMSEDEWLKTVADGFAEAYPGRLVTVKQK